MFPKDDIIIGNWVEKDASKNSDDLWHLRITAVNFDTYYQGVLQNSLVYELDKESGTIRLSLAGSSGTSALPITYYRKEELLGITNFFVSIPEVTRETKFERE